MWNSKKGFFSQQMRCLLPNDNVRLLFKTFEFKTWNHVNVLYEFGEDVVSDGDWFQQCKFGNKFIEEEQRRN